MITSREEFPRVVYRVCFSHHQFLPKPFLDVEEGRESKSRELEALNFRVRVEMERNLEGIDKEPATDFLKIF